jgi:putative flippase GtrA
MTKIKELLIKYKELLSYLIFGVLTTLVNLAAFWAFTKIFGEELYLVNNAIAWVVGVIFAFVTNKLFVFESKSWKGAIVVPELGGFFLARVATGAVDMLLMWLLIDVVLMGDMPAKILVNVIVIVLNYVASKLWIFRKK